ncbi:hypothetical protein ARMGADRAFT_1037092 [Armillaria gallica]|uniref:Uncharacterized protein n=1 Tax=Armillaria gallica TaxID=47427 RepID=A0A2H3CMN5_ARMGA|nr:hypothetical protein ARMGADRAFT_1037092 [Armillaria gallica]
MSRSCLSRFAKKRVHFPSFFPPKDPYLMAKGNIEGGAPKGIDFVCALQFPREMTLGLASTRLIETVLGYIVVQKGTSANMFVALATNGGIKGCGTGIVQEERRVLYVPPAGMKPSVELARWVVSQSRSQKEAMVSRRDGTASGKLSQWQRRELSGKKVKANHTERNERKRLTKKNQTSKLSQNPFILCLCGITKGFPSFLVAYDYSQIPQNDKQRDKLTEGARFVGQIESRSKREIAEQATRVIRRKSGFGACLGNIRHYFDDFRILVPVQKAAKDICDAHKLAIVDMALDLDTFTHGVYPMDFWLNVDLDTAWSFARRTTARCGARGSPPNKLNNLAYRARIVKMHRRKYPKHRLENGWEQSLWES